MPTVVFWWQNRAAKNALDLPEWACNVPTTAVVRTGQRAGGWLQQKRVGQSFLPDNQTDKKVLRSQKMGRSRRSLTFACADLGWGRWGRAPTNSRGWDQSCKPFYVTEGAIDVIYRYAEIMHSDWLIQVQWLLLPNQSALFPLNVTMLL